MKKNLSLLLLSLCLITLAYGESKFTLNALKNGIQPAIPKDAEIQTEDESDGAAFIAFQHGETNYQFTLSDDKESQQMPEGTFEIEKREVQFFRPLGESSGGAFIPLKNKQGSLVILMINGMFSDQTISLKDLENLCQKIDFSKFE